MTGFKEGDLVRFKGDEVLYQVTRVWIDSRNNHAYDLAPPDPDQFSEDPIESVPSRLLEKVKPEVKVGQVWTKDGSRLFVASPHPGTSDVWYVSINGIRFTSELRTEEIQTFDLELG